MRKYALFLSLLILYACGSPNKKNQAEAIDLQITVERLDRDLYRLLNDSTCSLLPELRVRYGNFFEYYNTGVINIGESHNEHYCDILHKFLQYSMVDSAYCKVNEVFVDDERLNAELTLAFKYFKLYFPERLVPRVITYVSGFNEALMLTDSAVGIGLDQFLGSDYGIYDKLGISVYLRNNMRPDRVPVACLQTWLVGEFPENTVTGNTLLARMIYEGKILYALEQCLPDKPFDMLIGYKPEQLAWCTGNEQLMWQYLIERQLLYITTPFMIQKYTGEAPFTAGFSQESPGKAANWLGYRIVSSYVKQSKCNLQELMAMADPVTILKDAKYNP